MLWNYFCRPQYIVVFEEHNPGQLFWFFRKKSAWRGQFLSKKVPDFCNWHRTMRAQAKTRSGMA
ncbi:MAG: hypothetical protein ACKOF3_09885, partial [Spartobacteria bacterium]